MNIIHTISSYYFSKRTLPYWGVLFLDSLIVLFAGYLDNYLALGGMEFATNFWKNTAGNLICVMMFLVAFRFFRTYTGIIRYSSLVDMERVGIATFAGAALSYCAGSVVDFIGTDAINMPSLPGCVVIFMCSSMIMWIERMAVRSLYEAYRFDDSVPAAIYGTKAGGISLANSLMNMKDGRYRLCAFVSDDPMMKNVTLMGKNILQNQEGIAVKLGQIGVKVLLVSPLKSQKFRDNSEMVDEFINAGIKLMMLPAAQEWDGKSDLTTQQLREVEIEDLLPRDKIEVDMDAIGSMLTGKRVLITGAAGSIGSEMVRQVAKYKPAELTLIDQAETPMHDLRLMMMRQFADVKNETIVSSIADKTHMEKIFAEYRPEYVFHAAAYKHVPMMEDNPAIAVRNNIYGTRVIADLAVKYGTKKFVMISTDKAVNPTNVMGCSKRICEIYCQSLNQEIQKIRNEGLQTTDEVLRQIDGSVPVTQFVTTRFGNVLGSNGSVIPIFKEQIKKGGPITVTHPDIIRFFMLIPEACKLVLEAGTMGKGGEIFVFDMGKPVKIVDLAKRMISLSGAQNIEIKYTGLRHGEKLYEEVLNDKEGTKKTHHPKIMIARVREYDYETAKKNEQQLLELSYTHDDMVIVKKMKEIVPEYKSRVSKYEVLDK